MIPPKGSWHRFENENEKISFLRKNKLIPKTKEKPIIYIDPRTSFPVVCDVLGYEANSFLVISVNDQLHCIHRDLLLEMQSLSLSYTGCEIKYIKDPQKSPLDFIVFDFETTDRNSRTAEIIEIGAVKYIGGIQVDTFQSLIQPIGQISLFAQAVNKITDDMLADAPAIEDVLPRFISFLDNLPLVAFNGASFDFHILERKCKELNLSIKTDGYDAYHVARKRLSGVDKYTLDYLREYCNLGSNGHRALDDALVTAEVWKRCFSNTFPEVVSGQKNSNLVIHESSPQWETTMQLRDALISAVKSIDQDYDTSYINAIHRKQEKSQTETEVVQILGITVFTLKSKRTRSAYFTQRFNAAFTAVGISLSPRSDGSIKVTPDQLLNWFKSTKLAAELYEVCLCSSDPFGCCSDYIACSDAKKCLKTDLMFFGRCQYRQNLRNGRIFYGKNKNV